MVAPMFATPRIIVLALASLLVVPLTTSCGKDGSGAPKVAKVTAGEMPLDGEWTGVYYDPYYGNLHLIREGDMVTGKWRKDAGDSWGELSGTIDENLLRYEWREHKIGMVGASADTGGKGYFLYKSSGVKNDPDYIEGERGFGEDEVGQKWKGIKQANVVPNPDEVMPDETEEPTVSSGWDDEGGGAPKGDADEPSGGGDEGGDDTEPSGDDGNTDF